MLLLMTSQWCFNKQ